MQHEGEEVHIDTQEVSGGDKDRSLVKMVVIGTLLAIGLLSMVWITGAVRFNQTTTPTADATANP
ncbi:hypothetical protein [Novosphingobium sp.]|uniref:hypothetical protein n=1 Tax=Novosphingobium sp. TaxID=1874826 RepID=UPI00262A78FD|nr:hypothetical protein [Novosphingobium sp.]